MTHAFKEETARLAASGFVICFALVGMVPIILTKENLGRTNVVNNHARVELTLPLYYVFFSALRV